MRRVRVNSRRERRKIEIGSGKEWEIKDSKRTVDSSSGLTLKPKFMYHVPSDEKLATLFVFTRNPTRQMRTEKAEFWSYRDLKDINVIYGMKHNKKRVDNCSFLDWKKWKPENRDYTKTRTRVHFSCDFGIKLELPRCRFSLMVF